MKCSYSGCSKPVRSEDLDYTQAMKFCETHGSEIDVILENFDVKKLMGWYVKAKGGAKRLVSSS